MIPSKNDVSSRRMETEFLKSYAPFTAFQGAASAFLLLPGLRGFWPMGAVGDRTILDFSGNGLHLTIDNAPDVYVQGMAPAVDFDAVSFQHLFRADHALFDILGTENYINPTERGLTLGAWIKMDVVNAQQALITKGAGGVATTSYWLELAASGQPRFLVGDGATLQGPGATEVVAAGSWNWIAGRFTPSSAVDTFVNLNKYTDAAGIPAALINSASAFDIGSYNNAGGLWMDGAMSLAFLCAAALPDRFIRGLYHASRALFGV